MAKGQNREEREAGRRLYWRWCGDPEGQTDRARYFDSMNPADKEAWARLAVEVKTAARGSVARDGVHVNFRLSTCLRLLPAEEVLKTAAPHPFKDRAQTAGGGMRR
jgi:hypothetical protein